MERHQLVQQEADVAPAARDALSVEEDDITAARAAKRINGPIAAFTWGPAPDLTPASRP